MPGNFFQSFIFLSKPHAWLIHIEEDAASEKIEAKSTESVYSLAL